MDYQSIADKYAMQYGVDPTLFRGLVNQESKWNPNAVSQVGAQGLTQVMPGTASDPGFGVSPLYDPYNAEESLRFGAEYLSKMMQRYGGDVDRALVAYNWGVGNADKWSGDPADLPAETRNYVSTVKGSSGDGVVSSQNRLASIRPQARTEPQNKLYGMVDTRQDPRNFMTQQSALHPTLSLTNFLE